MNYQLFKIINSFAGRIDWFDDIMEIFAQDIVWLLLALLATLWIIGTKEDQRSVFYACLSAGIALLLASLLISPEVNQARPFVSHTVHQLIPHSADPSFPSDHSTLAFSLAFSVLFINRKWGLAAFGLACLTGAARVYVGVHYPGDIIGAGALSFVICMSVFLSRSWLQPLPDFFIRINERLITALPGKRKG